MKQVLFICHANVGRSQMAEAYFNTYSKNAVAVSAGVDPLSPQKYNHPTQKIVYVMDEDGIDVRNKQVKFLDKRVFDDSDVVYVLCDSSLCPEYVQYSAKTVFFPCEDPYKMTVEKTREIRDEIKKLVRDMKDDI